MKVAIAVPVLAALLMLQMAIFSQTLLLQGAPDLVLVALLAWAIQKPVSTAWQWTVIGGLLVSYVSALPFGVYLAGYAAAVGLALLLKQRVWQLPILALLIAAFFGSMLSNLAALAALRITGAAIPFWQALNLVTLPSMLWNIGLAIPFYVIFAELAAVLHPEELEV
ncbi:MAG: hypothetical protein ACKOC5_14660 [Chloroflexota bacterium]